MRSACGDAHMKSILAVGELSTLTNVYRASLVAMMAGSDFIKTSTGSYFSCIGYFQLFQFQHFSKLRKGNCECDPTNWLGHVQGN